MWNTKSNRSIENLFVRIKLSPKLASLSILFRFNSAEYSKGNCPSFVLFCVLLFLFVCLLLLFSLFCCLYIWCSFFIILSRPECMFNKESELVYEKKSQCDIGILSHFLVRFKQKGNL